MSSIFTTILGAIIALAGMMGVQQFGNAGVTGVNSPSYWTLSNGILKPKNSSWIIASSTGGTGTSTQVTNGVNYFDGTKITSSANLLSFNGTNFGIATSSPSTTFGLVGNEYINGGLGIGIVNTTSGSANIVSTNYPQFTIQYSGNTACTLGETVNGFFVLASCNLGIGTTLPSSKLAVLGGVAIGNTSAFSDVAAPTGGFVVQRGSGIGTTTPDAMLQVATSTANATSTFEVGRTGQNKGTCIKLYDAVGSAVYVSVTGTTLNVTTGSCGAGTGTGF